MLAYGGLGRYRLVGLVGRLAVGALCVTACMSGDADVVLRGGAVYTLDSAQPWAEAVAVQGGRIIFVGSDQDVAALVGTGTEIVELNGRMLLPGFHDTHVHPVSGGIELGECDLNPAESPAEVARIVTECRDRFGGDGWLRGGGFQLPLFPRGAPSRQLLDSLVGDRPAYFSSADGHSAWVSTRALAIAGVDRTTPDPPPDGVIVREPDGHPQGTLRESAMGLVARHLPDYTDADVLAGLERGLALAASYGITTLHEASAREATLRAYRAAEEKGSLTARAIVAQYVNPDQGVAEVARLAALRDTYRGRLVMPNAAKIFADGVIEGGTAALLSDYLDRPGFRGELNWHPDSLMAVVAALDSADFKVHVHAIGDRAIRVTFDAFERVRSSRRRHIMAHIQLFDPADIPRFASLGVVASFQPLWAYEDTYITDLTVPRLGPTRSRWLYPIKSVVETGAVVAAGSDWSVSSMNPLMAIEVAITRRNPRVDAGPAWIPEEQVDLETMLAAYTLNGAIAGDLDQLTGSIEVGKLADLVVLEHNLFQLAPQQISDVRVDLTLLEGRTVFRRTAAP